VVATEPIFEMKFLATDDATSRRLGCLPLANGGHDGEPCAGKSPARFRKRGGSHPIFSFCKPTIAVLKAAWILVIKNNCTIFRQFI